jgi:hypothetical protein
MHHTVLVACSLQFTPQWQPLVAVNCIVLMTSLPVLLLLLTPNATAAATAGD